MTICHASSAILAFVLTTTSTIAASEIPVIDVYPRCDYRIVDNISAKSNLQVTGSETSEQLEEVFNSALSKLKKHAMANGDALILQKVTGKVTTNKPAYKHEKAEIDIQYELQAIVITLCTEDTSKPIIVAPYNAKGSRQLSTSSTGKIALPGFNITVSAADTYTRQQIEQNSISFVDGFHGVQLGQNRLQIETTLGPADNFFQHEDAVFTLSYGNQLWLTFSDDKLIQASHSFPAFTYQLTSQLPADYHPQVAAWLLDNRFNKSSLLSDIEDYYAQNLHQLSITEFALRQQDAILRLNFNNYHDLQSFQNRMKLADVSLELAEPPTLPPLHLPTQEQISSLATKFTTSPLQQASWAKIFSQLSVKNHSKLDQQKQLKIYRPELAAVFSGKKLREVQFSLLTQNANLTALQQLLTRFSFPKTKQQFITKYPDAFETSSKLVVYHDMLEINATLADDDVIDSFVLKWF